MDYPEKELLEIEAAMNADDAKNPTTVTLLGIAKHFLSDIHKQTELLDAIESRLISLETKIEELTNVLG